MRYSHEPGDELNHPKVVETDFAELDPRRGTFSAVEIKTTI
jgi:hypothetical protein